MHKCSTLLSLMTILTVALIGCSSEPVPHALTFYDYNGHRVATGEIMLPLPFAQGKIEGDWHLDYLARTSTQPITQTTTPLDHDGGHYAGDVGPQEITIRLHPDMADAGASLRGVPSAGSLSGQWFETSIAGDKEMGTFSATRIAAAATQPAK